MKTNTAGRELLRLESRRGNPGDRFGFLGAARLGEVIMLHYSQVDRRVDPNTNTQARRIWAAVSTIERIKEGAEPLSSHIIDEDRVNAAKEDE